MWKPLRNDIVDANKIFADMNLSYNPEDEFVPIERLAGAVEGLIEQHEHIIDRLIEVIINLDRIDLRYDSHVKTLFTTTVDSIQREYEHIMAIEYWLEDVTECQ